MCRPIVLIPGIGGSILVKRDAPYKQIGGRYVIHNRWIHLTPFLRDSLADWKRDMHYLVQRDPDPRHQGKILGLRDYDISRIDAHDIGGVDGIRNLVRDFDVLPKAHQQLIDRLYSYQYYNELIESLIGLGGYKVRTNLFGIPYDFRLVLDPGYRDGLFSNFRSILELAVANNTHGRSAVIVAHSLGVLLFKWFLSSGYVTDEWIAKHVFRLVAISPPFGGSVQSLKAVLCGDHYIPNFHTEILDVLQRNTGIIACLPNRYGYDPSDILWVVEDGARKIRVRDYDSLAEEGQLPLQIYRDLFIPHERDIFRPCSLDTHIVVCQGNRTAIQYTSKTAFSYPRESEAVPGDGVLCQRALEVARGIFPESRVSVIPNSSHSSLISHDKVIDLIRSYGDL